TGRRGIGGVLLIDTTDDRAAGFDWLDGAPPSVSNVIPFTRSWRIRISRSRTLTITSVAVASTTVPTIRCPFVNWTTSAPAVPRPTSGTASVSATSKTRNDCIRLVVDPLLHEARIALALAGHLRPAREQARRHEEEAIAQVRGVLAILL